jgi:hypothetical protein
MGRFNKGPGTTFPKDWKEIILTTGREGKSNKDFFPLLNIGHSTHFKLLRIDQEYKEVYDQYLLEHENYWVNVAKKVIEEQIGDFNLRLWNLLMGNKHRQTWKNANKKV